MFRLEAKIIDLLYTQMAEETAVAELIYRDLEDVAQRGGYVRISRPTSTSGLGSKIFFYLTINQQYHSLFNDEVIFEDGPLFRMYFQNLRSPQFTTPDFVLASHEYTVRTANPNSDFNRDWTVTGVFTLKEDVNQLNDLFNARVILEPLVSENTITNTNPTGIFE